MGVKEKLLKASLAHVELCGFRREAISRGAQMLDLSCAAQAMLVRGPFELVEAALLAAYDESLRGLAELKQAGQPGFSAALKALLARYVAGLLPYSARWAEAMAVLARPENAPHSLRLLRDFTRRAAAEALARPGLAERQFFRCSLASLLLLTELHLTTDGSPQLERSALFAAQRVDELARLRRGARGLYPVLAGAGVSLRSLAEALRHEAR